MKNIFSKTKKITGKSDTVKVLEISLMSGLIEDSWSLVSAFAFNLLQYVALMKKT